MSDTTGTQVAPQQKAPLRVGGEVLSIVPQTFEETMRIARAVCIGGLAPAALIGNLTGDNAASAVAIAIMSGAELGLQPMVSLRSFTVINGKPALYGDGLINVVRQSGKVAYLRTGCDNRDGILVGWCEAKRNDTGEDKRVEFSQDDAIRAGLWSDKAIIKKTGKNGDYEKPNDSPWYRYPQRMLAWRAAGWCLRELFGDVLGGIRDEFEAREIAEADQMRDVTPVQQITRSTRPPSPPAEDEEFDPEVFVATVIAAVNASPDEESLIATWEGLKVDVQLLEHTDALDELYDVRAKRLAQFEDEPEEGGQEQPDPDKQRDDAQDRAMTAGPRGEGDD
jgi:hypothetical protein